MSLDLGAAAHSPVAVRADILVFSSAAIASSTVASLSLFLDAFDCLFLEGMLVNTGMQKSNIK